MASVLHAPSTSPATDPGRAGHLPALDGVRAIAALLVIWSHIPAYTLPFAIHEARVRWIPGVLPGNWPLWIDEIRLWIHPGYFGVDLFFVLSGFLITRILLDEKARGVPVRYFLARRALRIFPIYYLLLLVVSIFDPSTDVLWCAAYVSNFRCVEHAFVPYIEPTWSLCVEEHFYLVWPWVVACLPSRKAIAWFLGGTAVVSIAWGVLTASTGAPSVSKALIVSTQYRVLSLGAGAVLALVEPRLFRHPRLYGWLGLAVAVATFFALRAIAFELLSHASTRPYAAVVFWLGMALISSALIVRAITCGNSRSPGAALLRSRPLRGIGRVSYGFYLYHLPVFYLFGMIGRPELDPPTLGTSLLAIATALAVATVSYFALERPLLRYGMRFRRRSTRAPALAT